MKPPDEITQRAVTGVSDELADPWKRAQSWLAKFEQRNPNDRKALEELEKERRAAFTLPPKRKPGPGGISARIIQGKPASRAEFEQISQKCAEMLKTELEQAPEIEPDEWELRIIQVMRENPKARGIKLMRKLDAGHTRPLQTGPWEGCPAKWEAAYLDPNKGWRRKIHKLISRLRHFCGS